MLTHQRDRNGDWWLVWRNRKVVGTGEVLDQEESQFATEQFSLLEQDGWGHPSYAIPKQWYCIADNCRRTGQPIPTRPYCPQTTQEIIACTTHKKILWWNVLLKQLNIPEQHWSQWHRLAQQTLARPPRTTVKKLRHRNT